MVLTNYCFNNTTDKGKYINNPKETSQVLIRQEPTITDWKRVTNIFKYLHSTKNNKIIYNGIGETIAFTIST